MEHLRLGKGMTLSLPLRHPQNSINALEALIGHLGRLDTLLSQIPRGRHDPPKFFKHLGMHFPRTSDPKPVILPGLHTVVPAGNNVPLKTLDVIRTVAVRGVLHRVSRMELLHYEVGEAEQLVEGS